MTQPVPGTELPMVQPIPTPTAWGFGVVKDNEGRVFVLIQVSHITGQLAVFVSPVEALDIGAKILEQGQAAQQLVTGLIVPPVVGGLVAPNGAPLRSSQPSSEPEPDKCGICGEAPDHKHDEAPSNSLT